MKSLFLFCAFICVEAAVCSELSPWNVCSRRVLEHDSAKGTASEPPKYVQRIDDLNREYEFDYIQAGLRSELTQVLNAELARILPGQKITLKDLKRKNVGPIVTYTLVKDGKETPLVRVFEFLRTEEMAQPGEVLYFNYRNEWDKEVRAGLAVVLDPEDDNRPLSEIQLSYGLIAEPFFRGFTPQKYVEGDVPHVAAIFHYEWSKPQWEESRPSRQELRRRSIERRDQRRLRESTRNPVLVEGETAAEDRWDYVQGNLYDVTARRERPGPGLVTPSVARTVFKQTFRAPSIYDDRVSLKNRLVKEASLAEGGAVTYTEYDLQRNLKVEVECNSANYCVETWYEDGQVVRTHNGLGGYLVRDVDRRRVETRPNQDFPWNTERIPEMALRRRPMITPTREPRAAEPRGILFLVEGNIFNGYTVSVRPQ